MAKEQHKKEKKIAAKAHDAAEKDMSGDPDLSRGDDTDDLDEGELAQRDNSDEEALDSLDRPRRSARKGNAVEKENESGKENAAGKQKARGKGQVTGRQKGK
ncbi:MAG TPA: hypothetical protein VN616_08270 [Puia sp.]|nr:hypothetical protein [Puia sp.]